MVKGKVKGKRLWDLGWGFFSVFSRKCHRPRQRKRKPQGSPWSDTQQGDTVLTPGSSLLPGPGKKDGSCLSLDIFVVEKSTRKQAEKDRG